MKIEIIPFASAINKKQIAGKTAVVIDVLRATSVMITALQNGAKEIVPVLTVEDALEVSIKFPKGSFLLCGERNAGKIKGFDLGNSTLEFTREMVENKTIIITTTNGTKALNACMNAEKILIGAFLNAEAVAKKVKNLEERTLFCAGTNGRFSLDDGICAAMIIDELSKNNKIDTDDLGHVLLNTWRSGDDNLDFLLKNCFHLKDLNKKGYENDVNYCIQTNISESVPVYNPKTGLVT